MTLPTDLNLPIPENLFKPDGKYNVETYLKELNDRLSDMYQAVSQNTDGFIRTWTPIVYGLSSEGEGTYQNQYGWLRRAGIFVECWMDVSWTNHTGSGRVGILMPYEAAKSEGSPFVGVIESSGLNDFGSGSYLTWRVEPDTTQGVIVRNADGEISSRLGLDTVGGFRGYIRYIGKEFED